MSAAEALNAARATGVSVAIEGDGLVFRAVTVQAGGQAIVGNVETRGGGSQPKSKEQPHAIAFAPGTEMPSANPERSTVPSASNAERPLPGPKTPAAARMWKQLA